MIRRRDFITLLGGTAAWPLAARAQQRAMPLVGYLSPGTPEAGAHNVAAFREGLSETGFVEGRNVAIEYRFANNVNDRLPQLAADLVSRRITALVASSLQAALAAKAATATIPIVFRTGADPVQNGLVAQFNMVWSPTSINPAVTSPASTTSAWISARSGWGYCATCCQLRHALPCSSIPPLNQASLRL